MPRRLAIAAGVVGALAFTGWVTQRLAAPAWRELRAAEPSLQVDNTVGALGQGVTLALLGGFRAITADFLWIKTNAYWERQDLPETQKMIDLVTTIDPRPLYFWINGARIIAYDMPFWRYDAQGSYDHVPAAVRRRIDVEQASAALALLERARGVHSNHPLLLIECANIHLRRLQDPATAAEYYCLAAQQPEAPFYAARIYAILLVQLGRVREAYDWLCALYPTLPRSDPMADAATVLARIHELARTLDVRPPDFGL